MQINEAQTVLAAQAANLTAAFRARGYEACVEIWIGRFKPEHALVFVDGAPDGWRHFPNGPDLVAVIAEAYARIAALPDNGPCDAWFDPTYSTCGPTAQATE